jgi:Chromo (CHRromatin Organisation MOdifier) domain
MSLSGYYKTFSLSKVPRENLRNEELANLYVKPKKEKRSERPKIIVWKANAVHQADLCEMPKDPLGFSYFLIVIDVATRKLDAEPLKTKTAQEVLDGFITIYARPYLQPPTVRLEVDAGNEFKSVVHNYFTNVLHVFIKTGQPGRHRQQGYAEKGIQTLQKPLIQRMTAQEMLTGQTSTEWSLDLPIMVEKLSKRWQRTPLPIPRGPPKITDINELLPEGTRVRVILDEPMSVLGQKLHGRFRTGDIRWNPEIKTIKKMILSPEQPPMYLVNGPHGRLGVSRCAYTRKQLQVVPQNENPPPDSIIRGTPKKYVPEEILKQRTRNGRLQYLVKWKRYPIEQSTWEPAQILQEDAPILVNKFLGVGMS